MSSLSIGIPVYNQVDTIEATILSILNQNVVPFEIVVCENHSTDGTREIVDKYADRVRIETPPTHLGMAANWNYCVSKCNGDWVGLCSGDDLLLPNYYKLMIKEIATHPDAVFVMGGWVNNYKDKNIREEKYLMSMGKVTMPPNTIKMLLEGPKASFAAFTFKKSTFQAVNGYDESFFLIQDWMLQFDMAFKGSFIRLDALVAEYSIISRPKLDTARDLVWVLDFIRFITTKIDKAVDSVSINRVRRAKQIILKRIFFLVIEKQIEFSKLPLNEFEKIAHEIGLSKQYRNFLVYKKAKNPNVNFGSLVKAKIKKVLISLKQPN